MLVGELLVTLGVLLGLFVFWQLFWTDVSASAEHQKILSSLNWTFKGSLPSASASPSTVSDPTPSGPPPVLSAPSAGSTFATLRVPRWGSDYVEPVSEGTDKHSVLDKLGIGHYSGTAMPGEKGNFALAGHRTTYGKPFNRIAELEVGDSLVVQTSDAWYVYKVYETLVVKPSDVWVVSPAGDMSGGEASRPIMTLTSCHPMFSARERYVVHAVLDYWSPVERVPVELEG